MEVETTQQEEGAVQAAVIDYPVFTFSNFERNDDGSYVDPRLEAAFDEYQKKLVEQEVANDVIILKLLEWERKKRTETRNKRPKMKRGEGKSKRGKKEQQQPQEDKPALEVAENGEEKKSAQKRPVSKRKRKSDQDAVVAAETAAVTGEPEKSEKVKKPRKKKKKIEGEDGKEEGGDEKKKPTNQSWLEASRRCGFLVKGQPFNQMPSATMLVDAQGSVIPKYIEEVVQNQEVDAEGKVVKELKTKKVKNPDYLEEKYTKVPNPEYFKVKEVEGAVMVEWCKSGQISVEKYNKWVEKRQKDGFYYDKSYIPPPQPASSSSSSASSSSESEAVQQPQHKTLEVEVASA